jgi:hypothetical protein
MAAQHPGREREGEAELAEIGRGDLAKRAEARVGVIVRSHAPVAVGLSCQGRHRDANQ